MVLPALREENLAKIEEENDKKCEVCLAKSEREEKLKNFWKRCFLKQSKNCFKKNLKYDLRLIEKQVWSIEPGRGSHKF